MLVEYNSLKRKQQYRENKEQHKCTKCRKPLEPDNSGDYHTLCPECRRKHLEYKYKGKEKRGEAKQNTLCWTCRNAVPTPNESGYGYKYGCEWSINRHPVNGWTAKKDEVKSTPRSLRSYQVIKCPKFIRDPPRKSAEMPENTQENA